MASGEKKWLVILLGLILLMRVGVLAGSQRWLNWDECIIGLLAKDVLRGNLHTYFPGQHYGGGAGIESIILAGMYLVLGVTPWAVKLYALAVSMATAVVLALFVRRVWGLRTACWACALWATAPGLGIFSLQVRAGYIEIQLLAAILLWLLHRVAFVPGARWTHFAGLGVVAGLAYYTFPLALPLLVAVLVAIATWDKLFWTRRRWLVALGGLIVGLSPAIAYDLHPEHRFAHFKWAIDQKRGGGAEYLLRRLRETTVYELPSFFQPQVDDFPDRVPWHAWLAFGLTAALAGCWAWQGRADIRAVLRRLLSLRSWPGPWTAGLETIMAVFIMLYIAMYVLGPSKSPRYFVGLHPALAIGLGLAAARAPAPSRGAIAGAAAALVASGLVTNLHLMNVPGIRAVLGEPKLREGRAEVDPAGIDALMGWLGERKIRNVFAHPIIKWKVMFYSNESIRGLSVFSTLQDDDKISRYAGQALTDIIETGESYVLVEHKDHAYEGPHGGWVGVAGGIAIVGEHQAQVEYYWLTFGEQLPATLRPAWPAKPESMVPRWQFIEQSLRQAGISWRTEQIGDYMVLHGFQGGSAVKTLVDRFGGWTRDPRLWSAASAP